MTNTDDLIYDDGMVHCPHDDCDWWVPEGLEYLHADHNQEHELEALLEDMRDRAEYVRYADIPATQELNRAADRLEEILNPNDD